MNKKTIVWCLLYEILEEIIHFNYSFSFMLHLLISKYLNAIIKLDNFILQKKGFLMNLNIEKAVELQMIKQVDRIMFILYPDHEQSIKNNNENDNVIKLEEPTSTALVVQKDYSIINPGVIFKVKKSIKLTLRSLFISASLTILNLFI